MEIIWNDKKWSESNIEEKVEILMDMYLKMGELFKRLETNQEALLEKVNNCATKDDLEKFDKKFDKKFNQIDKKFDEKFNLLDKKIDEKFDQIINKLNNGKSYSKSI